MKIDINININNHGCEVEAKLNQILLNQEKQMSASQDVLDAVAALQAAADNIAADIQRILVTSSELSPEAKQALTDIVTKLNDISNVVPG